MINYQKKSHPIAAAGASSASLLNLADENISLLNLRVGTERWSLLTSNSIVVNTALISNYINELVSYGYDVESATRSKDLIIKPNPIYFGVLNNELIMSYGPENALLANNHAEEVFFPFFAKTILGVIAKGEVSNSLCDYTASVPSGIMANGLGGQTLLGYSTPNNQVRTEFWGVNQSGGVMAVKVVGWDMDQDLVGLASLRVNLSFNVSPRRIVVTPVYHSNTPVERKEYLEAALTKALQANLSTAHFILGARENTGVVDPAWVAVSNRYLAVKEEVSMKLGMPIDAIRPVYGHPELFYISKIRYCLSSQEELKQVTLLLREASSSFDSESTTGSQLSEFDLDAFSISFNVGLRAVTNSIDMSKPGAQELHDFVSSHPQARYLTMYFATSLPGTEVLKNTKLYNLAREAEVDIFNMLLDPSDPESPTFKTMDNKAKRRLGQRSFGFLLPGVELSSDLLELKTSSWSMVDVATLRQTTTMGVIHNYVMSGLSEFVEDPTGVKDLIADLATMSITVSGNIAAFEAAAEQILGCPYAMYRQQTLLSYGYSEDELEMDLARLLKKGTLAGTDLSSPRFSMIVFLAETRRIEQMTDALNAVLANHYGMVRLHYQLDR